MDDELIARCSTLKITAEEDNIVEFENSTLNHENSNLDMAIVGKVMTRRPYNFEAFKNTMNQIWAISKDALFRPIEHGLFVVQFATYRDKVKVMTGRPWTFDQHLVMMNDIDKGLQPSDIALDWCPFWVRLYNLPLDYRTEHHIRMIGSSIGEVLEVESDGILWDRSARVKLLLNITKPLRRILKVRNSKGLVVMVEIKYERLPIFCYVCGVLGHMERDCTDGVEEEGREEKQWGAWLKASPRRGGLKKQEEVNRFLSCSRKLSFNREGKREKAAGVLEVEEGCLGEGPNVIREDQTKQKEKLQQAVVHEGTIAGSLEAVRDPSSGLTHRATNDSNKSNRDAIEVKSSATVCVESHGVVAPIIRGVQAVEENMGGGSGNSKAEQGMGSMESLSFSIGPPSLGNNKLKTKGRKAMVKKAGAGKNNGHIGLGDKRKDVGELQPWMDGDDVDMEVPGEVGKRLKMTLLNDGEQVPLTVAEVGADQPREGQ